MIQAWYAAYVGKRSGAYQVLVERFGRHGRIILKWVFKR